MLLFFLISAIATTTRHLSGKWLIYRKAELIDTIWEIVARATLDGSLGVAAKASILNFKFNTNKFLAHPRRDTGDMMSSLQHLLL